jgi:hypothetical protein
MAAICKEGNLVELIRFPRGMALDVRFTKRE